MSKSDYLVQEVIRFGNALSIRFMADWLGVEYKHKGTNKLGIDCLQLCLKFAEMKNTSLFVPENYPFDPIQTIRLIQTYQKLNHHLKTVSYTERKEHDFISIKDSHLGVMLTPDIYIHANLTLQKVIIHQLRRKLKYLYTFWRIENGNSSYR